MHGTPLDGRARSGHSSGLETPAMGTMDDRRGRYAAYTARLVDTVVTQPGHTPPQLRRAVLERAFGPHPLSKPETSSPLSGTERGTGGEDHTGERERGRTGDDLLAAYVDKVARHAYKVTDEDVSQLQHAGHSDDALFEVTISAALGAALGRLERGLAALRGESSPPDPLSASSSPPVPLSANAERGN